MIRIELFGNLRMSAGGKTVTAVNTNRLQSLLAYLILHADAPQPRDALAFTLWPASRESQARTNLRQLVHNLRHALPAECESLAIDHFALQWRREDSCHVDVWEFQSVIGDALSARKREDRNTECTSLAVAATIYCDDLLPALYDDWIIPFRDGYRRTMCDGLFRLAAMLEEEKQYTSAIPYVERLLVLEPLSEAYHQSLIRLHAANQDRASALRAYHRCMRLLRREVGVEPGPLTRQLFEDILKERDSAATGKDGYVSVAPSGKSLLRSQPQCLMVGRGSEWKRLKAAWDNAVESGPRVALIGGEAGIGKTRLADELHDWCGRGGHTVLRSRCYAGQSESSYSPVAALLRSEPVRGKWTELDRQHRLELARLIPEIAPSNAGPERTSVDPLNLVPDTWQRRRFFESLNALFGQVSKPVLLYIDDVQWCDPDTLEWLGAFLTLAAGQRVLLLLTLRYEEMDRGHPFTRFINGLRQLGVVDEIALERLDAEQTAELANFESAKRLTSDELNRIFQATRGNPLFVLESVRAGLQSPRVQAIISTRLARLGSSGYEAVALASVVGRPFSAELLQKSLDWEEASAFDALDELWRRRIVEGFGASEYDFTHDLIRQAAYAEITPVRRRYLHRRVAKALTEIHQTEVERWSGQIAAHLEQGGLIQEAISWFRRAAADARRRYADPEAAGLLRHALQLCTNLPESDFGLEQELTLLVALGPVLVTTEGYSASEVGSTYGRALELSRRFGDREIFVVLAGSWLYHIVRGDVQASKQFSIEFLKRTEEEQRPRLIVTGNFLLSSSLFHLGQMEAALHHIDEALRFIEGPSESILELFAGPDVEVFVRAYRSHVAWQHGELDLSIGEAERAIAVAKRIHQPFGEAVALAYAAMLDAFREDSQAAFEHARQGVEICNRYGFRYYRAMGNAMLGWAKGAQGDVSGGLQVIRGALQDLRELGAELRVPFYLKLMAETLGRANQVHEALAQIATAFAIAGKNSEAWVLPELYGTQGQLLAMEGRIDQAATSFRDGLEAARQCGSVALERKISVLLDRTPATCSAERL